MSVSYAVDQVVKQAEMYLSNLSDEERLQYWERLAEKFEKLAEEERDYQCWEDE